MCQELEHRYPMSQNGVLPQLKMSLLVTYYVLCGYAASSASLLHTRALQHASMFIEAHLLSLKGQVLQWCCLEKVARLKLGFLDASMFVLRRRVPGRALGCKIAGVQGS